MTQVPVWTDPFVAIEPIAWVKKKWRRVVWMDLNKNTIIPQFMLISEIHVTTPGIRRFTDIVTKIILFKTSEWLFVIS